jgi:hypothetical protein
MCPKARVEKGSILDGAAPENPLLIKHSKKPRLHVAKRVTVYRSFQDKDQTSIERTRCGPTSRSQNDRQRGPARIPSEDKGEGLTNQ